MDKIINGLTQTEATARLSQYGQNVIAEKEKNTLLHTLISQYTNMLSLILFVGGLFSFVIGERVDGFFIFFILIVNGIFGFVQQYRAEKTLEKLKNLTLPTARVIRDGLEHEIATRDIVPGDVAMLREGDRIPADGILLTNVALEIDESILTGESLPVEKKRDKELFSGTFVVQGRGEMKVSSTGFSTKLGAIAQEIKEIQRPKTPLEQSLDQFGKRLALIAISLSLLLIPIGIFQARPLKELILTTVSLVVAVVPEGLPLVITIALAVGAYRMARAKTIVRKMNAIETLGAANVILTDKTGTLTQNKMRVKTHWVRTKNEFSLLLKASLLGNTANLVLEEDGGAFDVVGDKTDGAFLMFAQHYKAELERYKEGKIIRETPFDPQTKLIEVEWEYHGKKYTFVRGAPERIEKLLKKSQKDAFTTHLKTYSKEGLRVIGFAYKTSHEKEFNVLGLIGIDDPPRKEAEEAIKSAQQAGIRVVMVTGDNPQTAFAIAEEVGLIQEGEIVLTSAEISKMSDKELTLLIPRVRIFARMEPTDKLRLVRLYKQAGFVVAVTGDGVNDALALSESHIGVVMGETGTDVAREEADIVITDDNIYTVVRAVEEGRGIFDNIIKVVVFLFSSNLAEFLLIFIGVLIGLPIPLTPTQILWVNLIGDGLPALALATDKKRSNLLRQKPRDIREHILNPRRLFYIAKITIPFVILLVAVFIVSLQYSSLHTARLVLFTILVLGEMGIIFLIRGGLRPINKFLLFSIALSILFQIVIILTPSLRAIFS